MIITDYKRFEDTTAKDNKVNSGILGAIVAKTEQGVHRVYESTETKYEIVKYKTAGYSNNGIPKCAVFLGIRHIEDL